MGHKWLWVLLLAAAAGWGATFHLAGTLGPQAGMQMILSVDGAQVTGASWDETISDRQTLAGTVQGTRATVQARGADHRASGTFAGTLSAGGRRFAGTWTSADAEVTLPFALTALAEYRTATSTTPALELTATYPVFLSTGAAWRALNATVAAGVSAAQRRFRTELPPGPPPGGTQYSQRLTVEVAYADATLASLLTTEDTYTGGAHPNLVYRSALYRMTGRQPARLSLSDLFDPASTYRAMLLELVVADLRAQKTERGAGPVPETFALRDITIYTISPYALTFHFAPYVAGAYAEGAYVVIFPYGSIQEFLHPKGPLAAFAEEL